MLLAIFDYSDFNKIIDIKEREGFLPAKSIPYLFRSLAPYAFFAIKFRQTILLKEELT